MNRDDFKDIISRFYAMRLIAIYWFTLDWKLCVWMGPLGMDFPLIILNKWNLPNSTSIDHNSLACCFFSQKLIFWKVWSHSYAIIYKIKVFFVLYAIKTSILRLFKLLHVLVTQQRSQRQNRECTKGYSRWKVE